MRTSASHTAAAAIQHIDRGRAGIERVLEVAPSGARGFQGIDDAATSRRSARRLGHVGRRRRRSARSVRLFEIYTGRERR